MKTTIFISSVQKELQAERRAIRDYVHRDPLLGRFFEVFLFEDLPASDRRADDVYIGEVDRCGVYVGLFGDEYGNEDADGLSPTEREFDRATSKGKVRLIFVKGADDKGREPKMRALLKKAGAQLIRRRFADTSELTAALYASLVDDLVRRGVIEDLPFERRPCGSATLDDIDGEAVATFVQRARHERQFPLPEGTPTTDVLTHLNLLYDGRPSYAAMLLFGREPQRFLPSAEVRCMHFHGTAIERPAPLYRVFKGTVFDQVNRAADFMLSVIRQSIGVRSKGPRAPATYEIPTEVVEEAIVNALAHRDYASAAAIQVSVFADRVEVWNPGELLPPLTLEKLREPHRSVLRNHRLCEALFLARHIEKYGTGTLMMIRKSIGHGLPAPDFAVSAGEFGVTIWRDWLTDAIMTQMDLNDRQRLAVARVKTAGRISNSEYQRLAKSIKKTATRDLDDLVVKGVLVRIGTTGRGTHYVLARKGDANGTKGTSGTRRPKGDMKGTKGTSRAGPRQGARKGPKG